MTHFVASMGTSGTIMGTGRYLKMRNRAIQVIGVEPDDPMHGLEGLKHMASSIVPGIYHESELDRKVAVSTEDAYDMVYALGQVEGLLLGSVFGGGDARGVARCPGAARGMRGDRSSPIPATSTCPPICGLAGRRGT